MSRGTIERMAARLGWLIWAMMAISLAVYLFAQLRVEIGGRPLVTHGAATLAPTPVRVIRHASGALALLALWQLWQMLRLIQSGDRFSHRVTRHLRHFALILFVSAALALVAGLAPIFLSDSHFSPTFINLRELWLMMISGGLFLVARLLDDAARVRAELDEMV